MQIVQVTNDQDATQNKIVVNYHRALSTLITDTLKKHGYSAAKVYTPYTEAIMVTLKSDVDH